MGFKPEFAGVSVKGRRDVNQDAFIAEKLTESSYIFAVADGMGGANGGGIASKVTLDSLYDYLTDAFKKSSEPESLKKILAGGFQSASSALKQKKKENPDLQGMGTTLSALLVSGREFCIGHIGDSRVYMMDGKGIYQLTKDHTYIEDYKDNHKGRIPSEVTEKYGHYLLKVLDGGDDEAAYYPEKKNSGLLPENCAFLLCSDGLIFEKVNTNTNLLRNYVLGTENLQEAAGQLVNYAWHNGSGDNITVLLVLIGGKSILKALNLKKYPDISENGKKELKSISPQKKIRYRKPLVLILLVLALAAVSGFLLLDYLNVI